MRVCVLELTACELRDALCYRSIEHGSIRRSQLVVVREHHLDRDTLGQLDRLIRTAPTT